MIAPATIPSLISRAFPIPSNAIPIVATVDQELPVAIDTSALIITEANKKIVGFKSFKP